MSEEQNTKPILEECATALIGSKRVVIFTGAGMSADSGINTFRGSSSGFWSGLTGRFALVYFGTPMGWKWTPRIAFNKFLKHFYKAVMGAEPNDGHRALVELEDVLAQNHSDKNIEGDFNVVTMNVDGFHQRAGHDPAKVHEVHGTVLAYRCHKKGHPMDISEELDNFIENNKYPKAICEECGSTPRPNIVLFTEGLPAEIWQSAEDSVSKLRTGDVMLVIGTSNKVYPAAGLPELAARRGATVYQFDIAEQSGVQNQIVGRASIVLPELVSIVKAKLS